MEQFSRTELLIGRDGLDKLRNSHIAIFGVGGVGGYVVEALVRSGVGELDIIDNDKVSVSNLNRQIIATHSTIDRDKVDVAKERMLDINPDVRVNCFNIFFSEETAGCFEFAKYDYVVDAIDTVAGKLMLIEKCKEYGVPVISSMGAGNKMHPEMFEIADISKTSVCPLARVMRTELKKRRIKDVKVVYSKEEPIKQKPPASIAFVPSAVGLIIAGEVIRDIVR